MTLVRPSSELGPTTLKNSTVTLTVQTRILVTNVFSTNGLVLSRTGLFFLLLSKTIVSQNRIKATMTLVVEPQRRMEQQQEQLMCNSNSKIPKTVMLDQEQEIDPWMQESQPLPESGYNSPAEETTTTDNSKSEEAEKSHDFYPTEKSITKREKVRYTATRIRYSPTRVKSRNFLSNISYNSISKADFYNENFILDVFILLVKNLNPFSLQRKISDKFKHEMIYMLWRECIPTAFYRFICQEENFRYLNSRDVSQPGVLEIVGKFVDEDKNNLRLLQQCLANYKDIFQYVYSCTYPEIYTMSEKRGIDMKSNFYILFKTFKDKLLLKQQQLAKRTEIYEAEHKDESEFEQKPVSVLKFNEFNDDEEKEIREQQREKNKKRKRQTMSDEERVVKLQKKTVENQEKEKQMW